MGHPGRAAAPAAARRQGQAGASRRPGPGLADFAGRWRLARRIEDARGVPIGRLEGEARLIPDDVGLTYEEEGRLALPGGTSVAASRRYLWRPDPGGIAVLFADERPFHLIAPGVGPEAEHLCGADLYRVGYDFSRWPGWVAVWRVTGPRKDYRMTSRYRPAA